MSRKCRHGGRCRSAVCTVLIAVFAVAGGIVVGAESSSKEKQEKADLTRSVNLRPMFEKAGLTARAQGGRGTCSVFTVAAALEYALAKKKGKCDDRVSVEYLNWASNQVTGRPDDGSLFSDLLAGFGSYGACGEADMPYRETFDPELQPSEEVIKRAKQLREIGLYGNWIKYWDSSKGLDDRQFEEIKKVLCKGWPVCGGFLWPRKGQEKWADGVLEMRSWRQVRDGHSVLLVGYRDDPTQAGGGVFLIRNSGGGLRHGEMPYEYARAYMNDAIWIGDVQAEQPPRPERPPRRERRPLKPWWLE